MRPELRDSNGRRSVTFILLCLIVSSVAPSGFSRAGDPKKNFALVKPSDSREDIISKAANIVPLPRQIAWQKMEFLAFVHFGMNTFMDRELGNGREHPSQFNPTNLNCDQWVRTFKDAGMKLAILTAKHHDGFCLWPSAYTEHCVKNSPWRNGKGDVVREFVDACRKYGLKVGLYLSPWDRNNPDYGTPKYNQYFSDQLRELLTNYGRIDEVWFDGYRGPDAKPQLYDWHGYYKIIRELQPDAVISISGPDVRWVGTESGYGRDTEWNVLPIDLSMLAEEDIAGEANPIDGVFVPRNYMGQDLGSREKLFGAKGLFWYPAEADVSIRPGWFYNAPQDTAVKPAAELVDIYFNSVGKNSVLLLNVPPDRAGLITDYDRRALMGFHKIIAEMFSNNLASNAEIKVGRSSTTFSASSLFGEGKSWTAEETADTSWLEILLPKEETFDVVDLQENIRVGQRIERFHLDYWDGHSWQKLTNGTTVGYKRLLRFHPVRTKQVRLVIEKSRLNPTLCAFGLYHLPDQYLGPQR
jgi:alpha-L-fucosidase